MKGLAKTLTGSILPRHIDRRTNKKDKIMILIAHYEHKTHFAEFDSLERFDIKKEMLDYDSPSKNPQGYYDDSIDVDKWNKPVVIN